jgi:hypothetical protein
MDDEVKDAHDVRDHSSDGADDAVMNASPGKATRSPAGGG